MTEAPIQRSRKVFFSLILIILTLAGVEGLVRVMAKAGWVQIRTFQTPYSGDGVRFVGDINPDFGVWHVTNASVTARSPRGNLSYKSNSFGMRDRPRVEKSDAARRVVVLGDSFVEGSYAEQPERFTDLLEERTGVEFLNFGTSGDFGSIQEWLLYQHLASRFDHTDVCLFLLPDNDFSDNDPARHPKDRYRPYLRRTNDSYEVYYPIPFGQAPARLKKMSWSRTLRHHLYNNYYTLNLLVRRDALNISRKLHANLKASSYDSFSDTDLDQLLFTYRKIVELSKPRPLTIVVIPRESDILAAKEGKVKGRIVAALSQFAKEQDRATIVDLLPIYLKYMEDNHVSSKVFFLGFDAHWSPLGHQVAADALQASLGIQNR